MVSGLDPVVVRDQEDHTPEIEGQEKLTQQCQRPIQCVSLTLSLTCRTGLRRV